MWVSATFGVLRRRWIPLILGLLVVMVGLGAIVTVQKPQYQASMTILMSEPEPNPYANVAGDKTVFTRLVGAVVSDVETSTELYAKGATAPYSVVISKSVQSSLSVSASSAVPELAATTVAAVVSAIGSSTSSLQAKLGVPVEYRIVARPLDAISVKPYTTNRVRLLALAAAAGVVFVVLGVFGLEALSAREEDGGVTPLRRAARLGKALWGQRVPLALGMALLASGALYMAKARPVYQASEVVILLPPDLPPRADAGPVQAAQVNPFLGYRQSFDVMAQVATLRVTDHASAERLAHAGASGDYSVINWVAGDNPVDTMATPTPYVAIGSTAKDAGTAMATVRQVGAAFVSELSAMQAANNAPRTTWMTAYTAVPAQVQRLPLSKARAIISVFTLALCVGLVLVRATRLGRRALSGLLS